METTSSLVAMRIRKVGWERFDMRNDPVQYEEATASTQNYMWNIWILVTARHLGRNLTGEEIIYWYFNWWYWLSLVKLFQKSPGVNMWFAGSPDFVISIAMLIFVLHHFQNLRRKFQTTFWIEGCHSNDCMGYDQELRRFCTKKLRILYIKWQITNVSLDMNM